MSAAFQFQPGKHKKEKEETERVKDHDNKCTTCQLGECAAASKYIISSLLGRFIEAQMNEQE